MSATDLLETPEQRAARLRMDTLGQGYLDPTRGLTQAQIDAMSGINAADYAPQDAGPDPTFAGGADPGFLERLGTTYDPNTIPADGVLGGLLSGFVGGLAKRGQRTAAAREKFNADLKDRQRERDKANLEATRALREARARGGQALAAEGRASLRSATADADRTARETVPATEGFLKDRPDLARRGVKPGDPVPRSEFYSEPRASGSAAGDDEEVKLIADAIEAGNQAPETRGLFRKAGPVRAELQRRGYNMLAAQQDWMATQRSIATLNGPQQTRLRQAADTAYESLDVIEQLNDKLRTLMPRGRVKILNRASMVAAKNGVYGPEAQAVATQLDAQISDVTSELGNVYMGGNSPTDHALGLAAKNLSGEWSPEQLKAGIDLARTNLKIRRNSIYNATSVIPGQPAPPRPGADRPSAGRPPLDSLWRP